MTFSSCLVGWSQPLSHILDKLGWSPNVPPDAGIFTAWQHGNGLDDWPIEQFSVWITEGYIIIPFQEDGHYQCTVANGHALLNMFLTCSVFSVVKISQITSSGPYPCFGSYNDFIILMYFYIHLLEPPAFSMVWSHGLPKLRFFGDQGWHGPAVETWMDHSFYQKNTENIIGQRVVYKKNIRNK